MIKVWEGVGVEVTMSWVKAVTIDSCLLARQLVLEYCRELCIVCDPLHCYIA